jgi:hypothetical protein
MRRVEGSPRVRRRSRQTVGFAAGLRGLFLGKFPTPLGTRKFVLILWNRFVRLAFRGATPLREP